MRPLVRLTVGVGAVVAWFGVFAPMARDVLLKKRSLRFNTVNVHTLAAAVEWADNTGEIGGISPTIRSRIADDNDKIRALLARENQMCQAIWATLPEEMRTEIEEQLPYNTPPPALTDSRFVDPYTPALIQAILSTYGYRREAVTIPTQPPDSLSMSRMLMVTTQMVEAQSLEPDQVARILDAALALDAAQRSRVEHEHLLAMSLPKPLLELAIRMQLQQAPPRR